MIQSQVTGSIDFFENLDKSSFPWYIVIADLYHTQNRVNRKRAALRGRLFSLPGFRLLKLKILFLKGMNILISQLLTATKKRAPHSVCLMIARSLRSLALAFPVRSFAPKSQTSLPQCLTDARPNPSTTAGASLGTFPNRTRWKTQPPALP